MPAAPMTQAELLAAVEAAGHALLAHGLRTDNLGFVLAATPTGLAAYKLVNVTTDDETLRTGIVKVLRDFADQVETGKIKIHATLPA